MNIEELNKEVRFKTSRSGGSGGQHVNKVSTKVELLFNVKESLVLSEIQKQKISDKLSNRIDLEGILHIQCDETRSQLKNKEIVLKDF